MKNIRRNKDTSYIRVPKSFIKVVDIAKFYGGYKNRQDYLTNLSNNIIKKDKKVEERLRDIDRKKGEFIEFDF